MSQQEIAAATRDPAVGDPAAPSSATAEHAGRPLRVLMVTGAYPTTQRPHWATFIKTLVDSLEREGVEVEVIHPAAGFMPRRYAEAALRVFLRTRGRRFDIVHGHYGLWCLAARMQWTTPVVAAFLGTDLLAGRGPGYRASRSERLTVAVSRWLSQHVDAATVKSAEMKRILGRDDAYVIADGIDFDLFQPIPRRSARAALGWETEGTYVLFGNDPGRPEKNYALAQAAVERLRAQGTAAELVVASGLPQRRLVWYINASNVVILPSLHEGSPNIVKEAMACNVPVVAADVGDVADLIGHTAGCAVCPHDADAFAAALARAIALEGPTTGRRDIAHLERSLVASQVIALYRDVLARRQPDRSASHAVEGWRPGRQQASQDARRSNVR